MKKLILITFGLGAMIGLAMLADRSASPSSPPSNPANQPRPNLAAEAQPSMPSMPTQRHQLQPSASFSGSSGPSTTVRSLTDPLVSDALAIKHSVDLLVSSQSNYGQKQAIWKQLKDAGQLDKAIGDLQERFAADPNTAAYPAALGQAYLQKCSGLQDMREQGILALQADKLFDTALGLDPSNWDARFTKTTALTYWPPSMNKGEEIVNNFQTLIQQQETQPPQPQFAEPYLWLGDQYQKTGQTDDARAIWQRGATLFPNHDGLKSRLASLQ